jgi:hypothetical protein
MPEKPHLNLSSLEVVAAQPQAADSRKISFASGLKNGIYFKVYDPAFLEDYAGEPVRFTTDGQDFIDTGAIFPEFSGRVQPEVETNIATHLPSQSQALSE